MSSPSGHGDRVQLRSGLPHRLSRRLREALRHCPSLPDHWCLASGSVRVGWLDAREPFRDERREAEEVLLRSRNEVS